MFAEQSLKRAVREFAFYNGEVSGVSRHVTFAAMLC
jgi:hypothetical protein